jgi:hypothetical protein
MTLIDTYLLVLLGYCALYLLVKYVYSLFFKAPGPTDLSERESSQTFEVAD